MAYNRSTIFHRIITWSLFLLQCLSYLFSRSDIKKLVLVSNPPFLPILGLFFSKKRRIIFDVIVYDIYPEILRKSGYVKSHSWIFLKWNIINREIYSCANKIFTISNSMKSEIQKCSPKSRVTVIYPWANTNFIKPIPRSKNWFVKKYDLLKKIIILYSGNMGISHDLETVLNVAKNLNNSNPEFHFLFIGDGAKKAKIQSFGNVENLKNITCLPFQNSTVLPFSLTSAHFGVITMEEGSQDLSLPSKTFYQLSAGNALIGISKEGSELDILISENDCGFSVRNGEVKELSSYLRNCSKQKIKKFGFNSRKLSKNYSQKNARLFL